MKHKFNKALAAASLFTVSALASCASGPVGSRYLQPNEEDVYAYGEFCGPRYPNLRAYDPNTQIRERIEAIVDIQPMDDIDRVCKAHDLCYERFGHDNLHCDKVLNTLLKTGLTELNYVYTGSSQSDGSFSLGSVVNEERSSAKADRRCENLALEISNGVNVFKSAEGSFGEGESRAAKSAFTIGMLAVGTYDMVNSMSKDEAAKTNLPNVFDVAGGGVYPDEPGQCYASAGVLDGLEAEAVVHLKAAQAAYAAYCKEDSPGCEERRGLGLFEMEIDGEKLYR